MGKFTIIETPIKGLILIKPKVFADERGFFLESWNEKEFQEVGIQAKFVQDNHSRSVKGVLRGLHFQYNYPQAKLVRVVRGKVFDVAVDLREGSPTFGKWFGVELSDENLRMLYIPEGFAHGFLVLSEYADFVYKVTDYYHPEDDYGIIWNDPDISISWPLEEYGIKEPILSKKDSQHPTLREWLSKIGNEQKRR
ncbi:dTDP-4-dehydrorhamnose 3,5-epimerase [Fervidobacterium sp.]